MFSQSVVLLVTLLSSEFVSGHPNGKFYKKANAAEGDVRSPCPALNTLANHGHLYVSLDSSTSSAKLTPSRPRNGKAITPDMFTKAIEDVYNFDSMLGYLFGHTAIPAVTNSTWDALTTQTLDLNQLNLHDGIEHDASLSRNDFIQGDNHSLQPKLLEALLADAEGDFITAESLAKSRARREKESLAAGSPPLTMKTTTLAYGESALILQALGIPDGAGNFKVPKASLRKWIGEERLPDGYVKPVKTISLSSISTLSSKVQDLVKKMKTT
jgi:hypothetical protein